MRSSYIASMVALLAVPAVVLAPVAPAAADPGREEIYRSLGVDTVPADYVILVDTSASMSDIYGDVRTTLGTFLGGLSATDYVAVFTFDSGAIARYRGPAAPIGRMLADVPATPEGSNTDIGKAIEEGIEELERPGAAEVASLVLITDGAHRPASGSDYPGASGRTWQQLKERAGRLPASSVKGLALPLGEEETGAGLLGAVVKQTETLEPSSVADLAGYLDRGKAQARLAKARIRLAGDLGKGVTATWRGPSRADLSDAAMPATLELRAATTATPLTVSGLRVTVPGGPTVSGDIPRLIELGPGETRSIPLTVRWPRDPGRVPFHDEATAAGPPAVTGTVSAPWAAGLRPEVDLRTPPAVQGALPRLTLVSTVGTWLAQAAAGALLLLLLAVLLLVARARRHPVQSGTLVAVSPMTGQELARFRLSGRSTRVGGQGLQGRGTVVARRVPPRADNADGIEYRITYRLLNRTQTSSLPPRGTVLIGGVAFEHQPG